MCVMKKKTVTSWIGRQFSKLGHTKVENPPSDSNAMAKIRATFNIVPFVFTEIRSIENSLDNLGWVTHVRLRVQSHYFSEYLPIVKENTNPFKLNKLALTIPSCQEALVRLASSIRAEALRKNDSVNIDPKFVALAAHSGAIWLRSKLFSEIDKVTNQVRGQELNTDTELHHAYFSLFINAISQICRKFEIELTTRLQRGDFLHLIKALMDEDLTANRLSFGGYNDLMGIFYMLIDEFDALDVIESLADIDSSAATVRSNFGYDVEKKLRQQPSIMQYIESTTRTTSTAQTYKNGTQILDILSIIRGNSIGRKKYVGIYRQLFLSDIDKILVVSQPSCISIHMPKELLKLVMEYDVTHSNEEVFHRLTTRPVYGYMPPTPGNEISSETLLL